MYLVPNVLKTSCNKLPLKIHLNTNKTVFQIDISFTSIYYERTIVMRYKLFITHEMCRKIEYRIRGLAESIGSGNRSKPASPTRRETQLRAQNALFSRGAAASNRVLLKARRAQRQFIFISVWRELNENGSRRLRSFARALLLFRFRCALCPPVYARTKGPRMSHEKRTIIPYIVFLNKKYR